MSSEHQIEVDKFLGKRPSLIVQEKISPVPIFQSKDLLEETAPTFARGMEVVRKVEETKGFQTNVSQIEVFYPYLLWREGLLRTKPPEKWISDSADTGTTIGDKLHRADILFNLIVDRVDFREVALRLPSHKPVDLEPYQAAMEGIDLPVEAGQAEIEETLVKAWTVFHSFRGFQTPANIPLFREGYIVPGEKEKVFYGDEVYTMGLLLAKSWAREAVSETPLTWEFELKAYTQREVLTSMNFLGPRLQLIARIDSVSRFGRTKKSVKSQTWDLKTGIGIETQGLAQDIEIRQAQVTRINTERFVSKYLVGEKSLAPRAEAFFWRGDHRNRAHIDRIDMVGRRRIDKKTGSMQIEPIEMDEAGRQEFESWFQWYGTLIHAYRDEIEKLRAKVKKAGFHYDLREISIAQ